MAGWSRPHRRYRFSGDRSSRALKRVQEAAVGPAGPVSGDLRRLAAVEDGHAQVWKKQIEALGKQVIEPRVSCN
jgi:hypothetical protein